MSETASNTMFPPELIKRAEAPSWEDCPVGTIAYHCRGGWWTKLSNGWRWWRRDGDVFAEPSSDAHLVKLPTVNP